MAHYLVNHIALHVDDFYITSSSNLCILDFKKQLTAEYKLMDHRLISQFTNMQYMKENNGGYGMGQKVVALEVLEKFGMGNCHSILTPLASGVCLSKEDSPVSEADHDDVKNLLY
ncbi:hypothetical protein FRB95_012976 [Tulasnella sp. JGI-2019a]|nr:hypothetical protein FRB95_012976 [Tulasnella sp. JGI-2019a]